MASAASRPARGTGCSAWIRGASRRRRPTLWTVAIDPDEYDFDDYDPMDERSVDPIRRSRKLLWWRSQPRAFLYAAMLGPCLDMAKLAGILASLPQRMQRQTGAA